MKTACYSWDTCTCMHGACTEGIYQNFMKLISFLSKIFCSLVHVHVQCQRFPHELFRNIYFIFQFHKIIHTLLDSCIQIHVDYYLNTTHTSAITRSWDLLTGFPLTFMMVWRNLRYRMSRFFSIERIKWWISDSWTLLHNGAFSRNISVSVIASSNYNWFLREKLLIKHISV